MKNSKISRRKALGTGAKVVAATAAIAATGTALNAKDTNEDKYAEPKKYGMPRQDVKIDFNKTAMVIIDPQVDFLSPKGVTWGVVGKNVTENNTVENLLKLFKVTAKVKMPVVISPHYYYPYDHKWKFGAPGEHLMHGIHMFDRAGPLNLEGFDGSGADWMPEFKEYIYSDNTIIASPHKIFGPQTNDVKLQLRKLKVDTIILAGMSANLCVESHMRDFIEDGFEVIIVKDATAGPIIPEGDGYQAMLTNARIIANDIWTTKKTVEKIEKAAKKGYA